MTRRPRPAGRCAGTAKEQAGEVVSEAREQARTLLDRTRTEVGGQASTQQQRAAESLRSLSGELRSMASAQQEPGMATDLAQQAADKAGQLASWLQDREPGDVLDEVSSLRPPSSRGVPGAGGRGGRHRRPPHARHRGRRALGSRQLRQVHVGVRPTHGRHGGTTDLTGTGDIDTTGTRPFTRATSGGMAGYPASDPLVTGTAVRRGPTSRRPRPHRGWARPGWEQPTPTRLLVLPGTM